MRRTYTIVSWLLLGAVILLAFILRLRGITWGLPRIPYFALDHPDELTSLECLFRMRPAALDFNPRYFVNPTLYYYLAGAFLKILSLVSVAFVSPFSPGELPVQQIGNLLLGARLLTVLVGVLTVYIVYEAGRGLYNRPVGLLSALILAVTPLHVVHSHYFTVNVAGALWVALVLLLSGRIWRSGERKWYLLAGLAIGLGTATKYFGILLLVPALTAHILRSTAPGVRRAGVASNTGLLLIALVVGFIIACPYSVLSPGEVIQGVKDGLAFNSFPPSLPRLVASLYYGLGPPLLVVTVICVVLLLLVRKPQDIIVLSYFLLFIIAAWYRASHFTRHLVPLTPALALIIGRGAEILWRRWSAVAWKCALGITVAAAVLYTGAYSWKYVTVMAEENPRDECVGWIEANVQPGERVGLFSPPWFYTPAFDRMRNPSVLIHRNIEQLHRETPAAFIVTSFEYDWLAHINSGAGIYIRKDFQDELAATRVFVEQDLPAAGYERAAVFSRDLRPPAFDWFSPRIPHDWEYPAPEILLFAKRK